MDALFGWPPILWLLRALLAYVLTVLLVRLVWNVRRLLGDPLPRIRKMRILDQDVEFALKSVPVQEGRNEEIISRLQAIESLFDAQRETRGNDE
jgi:hypothetical protein